MKGLRQRLTPTQGSGEIGVTPFLSLIGAPDGTFDHSVDFFSVAQAADAVDLDEIKTAAAQHPTLQAAPREHQPRRIPDCRESYERPDGRGGRLGLLCGPPAMTTLLANGFRGLGMPASRVR